MLVHIHISLPIFSQGKVLRATIEMKSKTESLQWKKLEGGLAMVSMSHMLAFPPLLPLVHSGRGSERTDTFASSPVLGA